MEMEDQVKIYKMIQNGNINVRRGGVYKLRLNFSELSDKKRAWEDLHSLRQDKASVVREDTADAIGSAFLHIPDKDQAWEDLIQLTQDRDNYVRKHAVSALGLILPYVPNNQQVWQKLHRFTYDNDKFLRLGAAKALGLSFPYITHLRHYEFKPPSVDRTIFKICSTHS